MGDKMFKWWGINKKGLKTSGVVFSKSKTLALLKIYKRNIFYIYQIKRHYKIITLFHRNPSQQCIYLFFQQLSSFIESGVSLLDAIAQLKNNEYHLVFRQLLERVYQSLRSGHTFSQALKQHNKIFSTLDIELIKASEHTGKLNELLKQIIQQRELKLSLNKQIRMALFYPAVVLSMSLIVSLVMLIFIVPQFSMLFQNQHASLPALTSFILLLSHFIQYHGIYLISASLFVTSLIIFACRYFQPIKRYKDRLLINLPLIGGFLRKYHTTYQLIILKTSLAAGIPLLSALSQAANATNNVIFQEAIQQAIQYIKQGNELSEALERSNYFPRSLIQLIKTGETSSKLTSMLDIIVSQHQQYLAQAVSQLQKRLEPLTMVILGSIIGTLLLAMYLPMFQIGMAL